MHEMTVTEYTEFRERLREIRRDENCSFPASNRPLAVEIMNTLPNLHTNSIGEMTSKFRVGNYSYEVTLSDNNVLDICVGQYAEGNNDD